jgi:hypothetical protein
VLGGLTAAWLILLAMMIHLASWRWISLARAPMLLTTLVAVCMLWPLPLGAGLLAGTPAWLVWSLIGLMAWGIGRWARRSAESARPAEPGTRDCERNTSP